MGIRACRFNTYLILLAALPLLLAGCQTEARLKKKQVTVLGVHLEARSDSSAGTGPTKVFREHTIELNIEKTPFLNEGMVSSAEVRDTPGGFVLNIQFDEHGTRLLEIYSAQNPGRRVVISCKFGKKLEHQRNLGAPMLPRRISNGTLQFTPDADRAEADEIAYGLNNLASKVEKGLFTER